MSKTSKGSRPKNPRDRALLQVRNLIQRLYVYGRAAADTDASTGGTVFFLKVGLGGCTLVGHNARLYRECIDGLMAVGGKNPETQPITRKTVTDHLQVAILRALRPPRRGELSRSTLERRLATELRGLRALVSSPPLEWRVWLPVGGIHASALPFRFGKVSFHESASKVVAEIVATVPDGKPERAGASDLEHRKKLRDGIARAFTVWSAVATITVQAVDGEAAERIAKDEVRRTLDTANFFAPFLDPKERDRRVYLAPDSPHAYDSNVTQRIGGKGCHWAVPWLGFGPTDRPLVSFNPRSKEGRTIGLARADEILRAEKRTNLEARIANALSWAGRAKVEHRPEVAFVFFGVALEALLAKPSARAGVTDRLRLRLAHLIGRDPTTRRRVHDHIDELYRLRSAIVHTGDVSELESPRLAEIRELVDYALTAVLTERRYVRMRRAEDFEAWLDAQPLFAGADDGAVRRRRSRQRRARPASTEQAAVR